MAVGGYGRGELSPGSDLDLLLLHADRDDLAGVAALADKVWYPVWDSGVRLDHSVRTFDEARRLASADLAVLLGLLDARPVAGEPVAGRAGCAPACSPTGVPSARRRLPELREMWDERGATHGDLRHDLEPDLKEGRGGLRDLVSLRAVAASWVADRPHRAADDAVRTARRRARRAAGRHRSLVDRLVQQEQDAVAAAAGARRRRRRCCAPSARPRRP